MSVRIGVAQKLKPNGEDRVVHRQLKNGYFYVGVFDGHNGSEAASYCEENLYSIIENELKSGLPTIEALRRSFMHAHNNIAGNSGTTATVVLTKDKYVVIAHVGDSRAVLCHGSKAVTITEDHRLTWAPERERIEAAQKRTKTLLIIGMHRVQGLALTRSIGDKSLTPEILYHPVVHQLVRAPEDRMLIVATDGVWDVMSGEECIEIIEKNQLSSPADIADQIVYCAYQKYQELNRRPDDITCSILAFVDSPQDNKSQR